MNYIIETAINSLAVEIGNFNESMLDKFLILKI